MIKINLYSAMIFSFIRFFFVVVLAWAGTFYYASASFANVPHDVVYDLVTSPNIKTDNNVYSIVRSNVLKSTDRGITWHRMVQGLDNKSKFQSIAIDPKTPQTLYVSTFADGIYASYNAGYSWRKINQGLDTLNLKKLYAAPANKANVVFAAGKKRALYKFTSAKQKWTKVYDESNPITAIAGIGWTGFGDRTVLIGDTQGVLSMSTDGGNVWQQIYQFSNCGEINTIATSANPSLANVFLLGTSKCGIFRTTDGGYSFVQVNSGITDLDIRSIIMSPSYDSDATVFASTWSQAIFISSDGGLTWRQNSENLKPSASGARQAAILNQPLFNNIAISSDFQNDKTLFLGGFDGLYRSINASELWQQMHTVTGALVQALAISPAYATDSTLAITTYAGGIYKSNDIGKNWQKIATDIDGRNYDVVFSPNFSVDGTMFVSSSFGTNNIGKSTDRGLTWTSLQLGLIKNDPTIIALSPAFAKDATLFSGTRHGEVYRSIDGGTHFSLVFNERFSMCSACVTGLVISPNYTHDQTVFAATETGIRISNDAGNSWILKAEQGIFGAHVKLAVSPNYALDHQLFLATLDGLFLTTDNLNTWQKISGDLVGVDGYVTAIAISPNYKNDQTLIITVKGKGVFKSENQGKSFRSLNSLLIKTNRSFELWDEFPEVSSAPIRFSPNYAVDKTIFAIYSERVLRSQDAGQTWKGFTP